DARDEPYEARLERGMRCVEAGADGIWISFRDDDSIKRIVKEIPKPMMGIPRRPSITPKMYGELGYKVAVLPGVLPAASAVRIDAALKAIKEHETEAPFFDSMAGAAELRAWSSNIGQAYATDLFAKYFPGGGSAGGGH